MYPNITPLKIAKLEFPGSQSCQLRYNDQSGSFTSPQANVSPSYFAFHSAQPKRLNTNIPYLIRPFKPTAEVKEEDSEEVKKDSSFSLFK